jgi:signal peptidase I
MIRSERIFGGQIKIGSIYFFMLQKGKDFIKETIFIVVLSLAVVLPIRAFIAQPYIVSGASMDDTFHNGNYLIVDEISYRFEEPKRGEVIVFKVPQAGLALQNLPENKTVYYIKRIIGLPGEKIQVRGDSIKIFNEQNPEGIILEEPYINLENLLNSPLIDLNREITLGDEEYFVMGDNRHNSSDSRIWGALPRENIIGKAFIRLFPFNKIDTKPGEYINYNIK